MTLLAPWALWFSAVAAGVVALYLLKIKRRRQTVPALDFWRQLVGQTQVRSLFQRLKRWLSLALWLLIVTCLILAIGNPVLSFGRIKPQSIAVIIDNSASMQAIEQALEEGKTETRFTEALRALNDLTTRRPVRDEWLLIDAAHEARVITPWTLDRKSIHDGAAAIRPHGGTADLSGAAALAAQLLEGKKDPCIVVLSDGADGAVEKLAKADARIAPWIIGTADDNLGIATLKVRVHREESMHYVYVRVVNASPAAVESQLVFEADGTTVAVEPLAVDAGGEWEKTITFSQPNGAVLRAWIDRADALADDNEAFAILPPIRAAAVLLVTPLAESFFFEQALTAMAPLVDAENSRTLTIEEFDAAAASAVSADLAIFNNCAPAKMPASGRFVFVNRWPAEIPAKVNGLLERPEMVLTSRDHPLMRFVSVSSVALVKAHDVTLSERATILAESNDGSPLVFLHEAPDRQSLCVAFDVMESDLPFRNAFPVLLRNTVAHMVSEQSLWIADQYHVGDVITPLRALPSDVTAVDVARLNQTGVNEARTAVERGAFAYANTASRGPLRFTIGDDIAYTAVNLADATESRIAIVKPEKTPAELLALSDRLFGTVPWLALAAIAATLIGVEWMTYHHRWTE